MTFLINFHAGFFNDRCIQRQLAFDLCSQFVGRAGRGKDKNAVCVTLCRRTKYDADAWHNPTMLMSGIVRTPTVFTQNRIIAQRHFNAVLFALFLRIKVKDEKLIGDDIIAVFRWVRPDSHNV